MSTPLPRWMPRCLLWICVAVFLSAANHSPAGPPDNGWTLVWSDEFNGTALDTSVWSYFTGTNQGGYDDSGPPTISVSNGALNLLTWTNTTGVVHTGWIWSSQFTGVYGYWEARIRFNESSGEWSAFWLQPDSINTVASPADPANNGTEIDIVEHRTVNSSGTNISDKADINLHWNGYGSSEVNAGPGTVSNPTSTSLQGNWHTYGMRWYPSGYNFYIDGIWVGSSTSGISMRAQWIYLSTFVNGASWAGPVVAYGLSTASTTKMEVDYVRYYLPTETITNADLDGRKQPWSGSNSAWLSGTTGTTAYSGTTGLTLTPTSTAQAIASQTVYGLLPNTNYVLTAWAKGAATIGANSFGGSEASQAVTSSTFSLATVPFTTGATNRSASVFGRAAAGSGTSYADYFLLRRAATVDNGSLELGDATGWGLYGTSSVTRLSAAYGGLYALGFTASTAAAGAQQDVAGLTPGTAYRLSGWASTSGSAVTLGVNGYGGSQVSTAVSASGWTRGTVDFTTGATNTTATVFAFRAASATGTGYADSLFLYQPLASPWADQDVTAIPLSGVAGTLGTRFVMQASGAGIGGTSDKFHFVYKPMTGNSTITAQAVGLDSNDAAATMGVMMRGSNSSFAPAAAVLWHPDGTMEFNYRATSGGTSVSQTVSGVNTPPWMRLTRRGSNLRADYSTDNVTWTRFGEATVSMSSTANVGLAATSGDTTVLVQPVFDNVSVAVAVPEVTTAAKGAITLTGVPTRLRITASAYSDTTPAIAWTKAAGPGTVTFANTTGLDTTALFSQTGTYVLQCGATDSYGTGTVQIPVVVVDPVDSTLSLWWKLNESSGAAAADSSGAANPGTVTGSPTWQPSGGPIGGTLLFNGTDSYITVPDSSSLDVSTAFTLAYWCRLNTTSAVEALVSKRNGLMDNNAFTTFVQTDGLLNVDIDSYNNRFTSNTVFTTGTWYHVAVVFDGSLVAAQRAKLYINGVLDVTATESSTSIPNYSSALRAGITNAGSTAYFSGNLDDIRLYQRALTATEVAAVGSGLFAPAVKVGTAPAAVNSVAANLTGSVTNELAGTPTIAWSVVSGPTGAVTTFGSTSAPTTTAFFRQAGTYVLRLTASNAAAEVSSDLIVTVAPNPNLYSDWVGTAYPGVTNQNIIGPQADPDQDGLSNLTEWALGLDPTKGDAVSSTSTRAGLPVQSSITVSGSTYLSLAVRRPIGRSGVTYAGEVSSDLANWSTTVQEGNPTANGDGSETVIFRDSVPQGQTSSRFIRLKLSQ